MKRILFSLILLFYGVANSFFVKAQSPAHIETLKKSVVKITAYDNTGQTKEGTGVLVGRENGNIFILTAYHVVKDSAKLEVRYHKIDIISEGQLRYKNDDLDIGVVIAQLGSNSGLYNSFPQLPEADFSQLAELMRVIGIGHPLGKEWRPIDTKIQSLIYEDDSRKLAIEKIATIKQGCSGGPLFDEHQNLIGIITETDASEAVVVKINEVLKLFDHRGIPANLITSSSLTPKEEHFRGRTDLKKIRFSADEDNVHSPSLLFDMVEYEGLIQLVFEPRQLRNVSVCDRSSFSLAGQTYAEILKKYVTKMYPSCFTWEEKDITVFVKANNDKKSTIRKKETAKGIENFFCNCSDDAISRRIERLSKSELFKKKF